MDTINLLFALKNIRRIFVGQWARNTPTMVPRLRVELSEPEATRLRRAPLPHTVYRGIFL